jgi:hypothetical protein
MTMELDYGRNGPEPHNCLAYHCSMTLIHVTLGLGKDQRMDSFDLDGPRGSNAKAYREVASRRRMLEE